MMPTTTHTITPNTTWPGRYELGSQCSAPSNDWHWTHQETYEELLDAGHGGGGGVLLVRPLLLEYCGLEDNFEDTTDL